MGFVSNAFKLLAGLIFAIFLQGIAVDWLEPYFHRQDEAYAAKGQAMPKDFFVAVRPDRRYASFEMVALAQLEQYRAANPGMTLWLEANEMSNPFGGKDAKGRHAKPYEYKVTSRSAESITVKIEHDLGDGKGYSTYMIKKEEKVALGEHQQDEFHLARGTSALEDVYIAVHPDKDSDAFDTILWTELEQYRSAHPNMTLWLQNDDDSNFPKSRDDRRPYNKPDSYTVKTRNANDMTVIVDHWYRRDGIGFSSYSLNRREEIKPVSYTTSKRAYFIKAAEISGRAIFSLILLLLAVFAYMRARANAKEASQGTYPTFGLVLKNLALLVTRWICSALLFLAMVFVCDRLLVFAFGYYSWRGDKLPTSYELVMDIGEGKCQRVRSKELAQFKQEHPQATLWLQDKGCQWPRSRILTRTEQELRIELWYGDDFGETITRYRVNRQEQIILESVESNNGLLALLAALMALFLTGGLLDLFGRLRKRWAQSRHGT